mgnify:CR=1 FL=1
MKKLILILSIAFVSLSAFSQNLWMSNGVTPYTNSDTIVVIRDNSYKDSLLIVHLYVESMTTITTKVHRFDVDVLNSTMCTFCYGGKCYGPTVTESQAETIHVNDKKEIEIDYKPLGSIHTTIFRYSVFDVNNISDSAWVYVLFKFNSGVGIDEHKNEFSISNAYPNPAQDFVSVNYTSGPESEQFKFVISDMLGSTVKVISLRDQQGTVKVSVDELENGVYFYSFITERYVLVTRKLIIRH